MLIKPKATKIEFDELVKRHERLCDLLKESNNKLSALEGQHQALRPVFEALIEKADLMQSESIARRQEIVKILEKMLDKHD